jgi:hypothetical protein
MGADVTTTDGERRNLRHCLLTSNEMYKYMQAANTKDFDKFLALPQGSTLAAQMGLGASTLLHYALRDLEIMGS